ncbi:MAG: Ig-like domain-containing protein, partial [Anaerolineales bacterium]|nr:Ig-like domain-containing protein [Anaerolineales bacterium]
MTTNQRHERGAAPKKGTSILLACLIGLSLACSLPGLFTRATPTPAAQGSLAPPPAAATPPPQPAPPAIGEVQPPPGEELPLDGAITLYFNQPMDSASVEAAISSEPSLPARLTWSDASTLVVQPGARLVPGSELTVNIGSQARSASGLAMMQAASLKFRAVGALRLAQALPRDQAEQVDPTSAVAAAFNRPVVSLGAETASQPPAFTVLAMDGSTANGRGEWSNTSTYIFYPEPALEGGKRYRVALNTDLQGVGGSPLEEASEWSFTTAPPQLVAIQPAGGDQRVRLDAPVVMTFNQPMDQASVEVNFRLLDSRSNAIPGNFTWDEAGEVVTYTAERLLERDQTYTLALDGRSLARGGTPLGETQRFQVRSAPALAILGSDPQTGGMKPVYAPVLVTLSAPVPEGEFMKYVRLDPPVDDLNGWQDSEQGVLNLYGNLAPDTEYTLSISADLRDLWGGKLGQDFKLNFRTRPLDPSLMINGGSSVLYLTPADSTLSAQVVNVSRLNLALGEVSLIDFMALLGPEGYSLRQSLRPAADRAWVQPIESTPNRNQVVQVGLTPEGGSLAAGLYALRVSIDPLTTDANLTLLVVSRAHLTYKLSPTQAMVWAVDLERDAPLAGAPVTIYDQTGTVLADGQTDSEGVFRDEIPTLSNPYEATYAVLGAPGDENFGLAMATWNMGTSAWDFDLPTSFDPPRLQAYLYTDRPIYRPGQTVYFRGVLRQAYNGRYKLPEAAQSKQAFSLALTTGEGQQVSAFDLPVSALGTFHGEAVLPADAAPGVYRLASKEEGVGEVYFQVADYRKPEINLQVGFEAGNAVAGESLTGQVGARYFFDAPAGNVKVHWGLYAATEPFSLPDYQVGVEEASWLETFNMPRLRTGLGELLAEGEATTALDGTLELALPAQEAENRRRLTLEVTATDESGLPVSGRGQMALHPAAFYIGLRPDSWVGRAGESASFAVRTVDWEQEPASVKSLRAVFQKVVWEEQEPVAQGPDLGQTYVPKYTPIGSTDFVTSQDGEARLAFTPPQPGVYQLEVSGGGARSQLYLWVGGEGEAIWPNLPNQRIRLTADRERYQPGDTAQVFIPNPFGEGALALLTVERGEVLRHQLLRLEASGSTLSLPLSSEEAPNVYLAVTLLGKTQDGRPDFRQGYLQVKVEPVEQVLNVALTRQPERAGPGDEVTFEIEVRDAAGQPVQGEFSLAVVDLAALALADPNSADIVSAYYGEQPLGVQTGLDMAVYANRLVFLPGGLGGGGGEAITSVTRENFPDTAYWNAQVVTDEQGRASLSVQLPDTLTTWHTTLRGLTADSRVGEAVTQVVTSKELLVRPA